MLGMGLGFEMPVILLTLVKIGILDYQRLRSMWRYMIIINLVLGAVLTTPEVLTQILMALPLYLLYEVSVWIAWYWERPAAAKRRARWLLVVAVLALAVLIWWLSQYGRFLLPRHRG
jgi:sec-independent protein translocase protein TatC